MTGKKIFGLKLFAVILILFSLIRSNSSEKLDSDARTQQLAQDTTDAVRRTPSLIDRLRHGNDWNLKQNGKDASEVMETNPITMEKAIQSNVREENHRKKRFVFLLPLLPLFGGLSVSAGTAAAVAAVGVGATAAVVASQQKPLSFQGPTFYSSYPDTPTVMESSKTRKGQLPPGQTYHPAPKTKDVAGFPGLVEQTPKTPKNNGGGLRKRWKDPKTKRTYEWDSQHGELEGYDKNGNHIGSFDPNTGEQTGEPKPDRKLRN